MTSTSRRSVLAAGGWLGGAAVGGLMGASAVAASAPASSSHGTHKAQDLDYQMIYQRAIEAVLWSMPALSDVFFRESLFRDFGMKPGDVIVFPQSQILGRDSPLGKNGRGFGKYQSRPTHGTASQMNQVPVIAVSVLARVLAHGGDENAVRNADTSQLNRGKQERFRH